MSRPSLLTRPSGSREPAGVTAGGLDDGSLTNDPRSASVRDYLSSNIDRLVGSDPGLTQFRTALQAVLAIAAAVGLSYLFVKLTGALQLPAGAGPVVVISRYNHALLVVAMLLSGMVAMMASFVVSDVTARGQIFSTFYLPLPMLAALTIGLALGPDRVASLVWLVVLLTIAVYIRRFGPRGFATGLVLFNGGFLGFFLHAEIKLSQLGWIAATLAVGVLASLIVRFTLFRPDQAGVLARMRRSWIARAHRLAGLCVALLDADTARERRQLTVALQRQYARLNESTLMIDAQLVGSRTSSLAAVEHQQLFDAELALANTARFVAALVTHDADPQLRRQARVALSALVREDDAAATAAADHLEQAQDANQRTQIVVHRLAQSVQRYVSARTALRAAIVDREEGLATAAFTPAVQLANGFLPGSVPVSAAASTTPGRGWFNHATLAPYLRTSIQMAVSATIAVIVGDVVSGPRLYWALLATFLAFMATTNSGEQVRKALFRALGTGVGIVLGDVLVRATGGHLWISLVIVLVALFFGIYLIRINYTFMAMGITVTMSQLYVQLDEFSWNLLLLRLAETAIGVGAVIVTVLLVVPLRPQRVLTAGVLMWFRATSTLIDESLQRLLGGAPGPLRTEIRQLDAAYAALEATAVPLRRAVFGRNSAQLSEVRAVSAALRNYARSLAVSAEELGPCLPDPHLEAAARQLCSSMHAIESRIELGGHAVYVRAASLFAVALDSVPRSQGELRLALRDLTMIDGALARLAQALAMSVVDLETAPDPDPDDTGQDDGSNDHRPDAPLVVISAPAARGNGAHRAGRVETHS